MPCILFSSSEEGGFTAAITTSTVSSVSVSFSAFFLDCSCFTRPFMGFGFFGEPGFFFFRGEPGGLFLFFRGEPGLLFDPFLRGEPGGLLLLARGEDEASS